MLSLLYHILKYDMLQNIYFSKNTIQLMYVEIFRQKYPKTKSRLNISSED